MEDDEEIIDSNEEPDGEPEPEPEEKLLGKFASVDELAKAYQEVESRSARAERRIAELERTSTQTPPGNPPVQQSATGFEDWKQQINERFYEDPYAVVTEVSGAMLQQYATTRDVAEANLEMIVAQKESDPKFKAIQRRFAAEMKRRGGLGLANPQTAAQLADEVERLVYGDVYMEQLKKVSENPAERKAALERLGLHSPEPSDDRGRRTLPRDSGDILAGLGLGGNDAKDVVKSYMERDED